MTCIILEVYIVIWQEILIVNINFTLFPLPKTAIFVPRLPYLWKNCQMAASNLYTTYFEISQDYFHQVDIKFSGKAHTNHHIQNLNICHFTFCRFLILIIGQWPAMCSRQQQLATNKISRKLGIRGVQFKFWIWWLVYTLELQIRFGINHRLHYPISNMLLNQDCRS